MNLWPLMRSRRRRVSRPVLGGTGELPFLESRTLLSAHVGTAHVHADKQMGPAQPYEGLWKTHTTFGDGKANITENGKKGTVSIQFDANDDWSFAGNAKFTNAGVMKAKILGNVPEFFQGTLKLKVKLTDATHFSGTAKVPGKGATEFSGERFEA